MLQVHRYGADPYAHVMVEGALVAREGECLWVDVIDVTDEDLATLAHAFDVDVRTFEEANRRAMRPTLQHFPDHTYLVAFSRQHAEIDMYLGPGWLVTVRRHDPGGAEWDPSVAQQRFERRAQHDADVSLLLALMIDELVDGYFDEADVLEDRLEIAEDEIFADDGSDDDGASSRTERQVQALLFSLRRDLMRLRRDINPLREVLQAILRSEVPNIRPDTEAMVILRDTYDRLLRAVDVVDELRDLVGNASESHLAVISNQTNLVMKRLTAWGSILFVAALIAGIYGMNFDKMPELRWQLGYPFALGTMLVTGLVLYIIFKRRRWI